MKKILFVALLGLMTIATAMAAIDNTPVSMTITLKNGNTVTYAASNMDSVRFVGGKFGDNGAIGMKIYLKGQTPKHRLPLLSNHQRDRGHPASGFQQHLYTRDKCLSTRCRQEVYPCI